MAHDLEVMRLAVRGYLAEIKRERDELDWLRGRLDECESSLVYAGIDLGKCGSGNAHGLDDGIARMLELREEYRTALASNAESIDAAARIMSASYPARHALWLKYIVGMTWDAVALEMDFSSSYLRNLAINSGVMQVYYAMPEEFRRNAFPNAIT